MQKQFYVDQCLILSLSAVRAPPSSATSTLHLLPSSQDGEFITQGKFTVGTVGDVSPNVFYSSIVHTFQMSKIYNIPERAGRERTFADMEADND